MQVMTTLAHRHQTRSGNHHTATETRSGTLQAPSIAHLIAHIAIVTKNQKTNTTKTTHQIDEANPATTCPPRQRAGAVVTVNTTEAADLAATTTKTETEIVTEKIDIVTVNAPAATATTLKPQNPNSKIHPATSPAATSVTINTNLNLNPNRATEQPPPSPTETPAEKH